MKLPDKRTTEIEATCKAVKPSNSIEWSMATLKLLARTDIPKLLAEREEREAEIENLTRRCTEQDVEITQANRMYVAQREIAEGFESEAAALREEGERLRHLGRQFAWIEDNPNEVTELERKAARAESTEKKLEAVRKWHTKLDVLTSDTVYAGCCEIETIDLKKLYDMEDELMAILDAGKKGE